MKKTIVLLALFPLTVFAQTTNTSIRGVVTFFFNKYQGDKPDVGAEVYIIDSATSKINEKIVDSFHYANFYKNMKADYKAMNEPVPDNVQTEVANYRAEDEIYFKDLDGRCYSQYLKAKGNDENYTASVDASGAYNINLKPGVYYVFIKSHNRKGMTITEISGKMFFKKVRVKAERSVNVSTNFDLH